MINSWIVAQNLNFWFLHDALCFEKYNVGERRKIHHFRLLVKKARQAFRGTLKVAFLTYAPWSSWSWKKKKKSLKGVSKAEHSFVYKNLLGAWNPAKYRISIQRSQVWRETWWMRSLLFRVRDQATSVLALTFQEEICREIKRTKKVNTEQKMPRFEWFISKARSLKIIEKVSFNIACETNYVYILSGQKFINIKKCPKMIDFGDCFKP